ncbi:FAD-dependent monooxygenase [Streptomyces sp. CA-181903]|uniref:FAD-dependent monooxygenase n=1 Tax=Streptomyces sp. CA-181903 TaxID=3240055 RepID=UPI003D906E2B
MNPDVIVVGAGPTGLTLANELGLAGVRTVVLERTLERGGQSRALNLQPRTAEVLGLRGWLEPIAEQALTTLPRGHFAGIPLDYSVFDTRFPYQIGIPQARVERFLEEHLASYGIPALRGRELTGLAQDADGVTATVAGPDGTTTLRAAYLAGADGGRGRKRPPPGPTPLVRRPLLTRPRPQPAARRSTVDGQASGSASLNSTRSSPSRPTTSVSSGRGCDGSSSKDSRTRVSAAPEAWDRLHVPAASNAFSFR